MVRVQYGPVWKHYSKGLTNRRTLLLLGTLMTAVGVVGFFVDTKAGDLYHLDTGQNIAYVVMGLAALLVGEVWTSSWKRAFLGLEGAFLLSIAIAGFAIASGSDHDLGMFDVEHPWENVAHTVFGGAFLFTALYPRRFRDYAYGTAVSD